MKTRHQGFTRIELLFIAGGLGLLSVSAVSIFGHNQSDAQRVVCSNNLRQIGRAYQSWANDHGDLYPWRVSYQTDGGTGQHPLGVNTWFQFLALSNYLATPRFLVCPADALTLKSADNWSFGAGGLATTLYRDNAVSYIVALHARPYTAASLLSGDRNIRYTQNAVSCSFLPQSVCRTLGAFDSILAWTNSIHG